MSGNSSAIKVQNGKDALFQFYSGTTYTASLSNPVYVEHDLRIYKSSVTVPAGPFNLADWTPVYNYGITGGTNQGGGSGTIYISNANASLNLRTISGGTNVSVQQIGDVIRINSLGSGTGTTSFSGLTSFSNIGTGTGLVGANISGGDNLQLRTISGGTNIVVSTLGNNVNIRTPLVQGITGNTSLGGANSIISSQSANLLRFKTISGGTNITITPVGDVLRIQAAGGGSTSPAGANTNVQFNNSGAFGGDSAFSFNNTTKSIISGSATFAGGNFAHSEGNASCANGNFSHAEGNASCSLGISSHAEGFTSKSFGLYSHAEGNTTCASGSSSHAEGRSTIAYGACSHVEGGFTIAIGLSSHAEGFGTCAIGDYSHAEGLNSCSAGVNSHSEGNSNKAIGAYSHAEGFSTCATGNFSHSEGGSNDALGCYSHVEGTSNCACGIGSHVEGIANISVGCYSHVEGISNTTTGKHSHAEGTSNCTIGDFSHVEGRCSISVGLYSHASGSFTNATGEASFTGGKGVNEAGKFVNACGLNSFNFSETDTSQISGHGALARSSAILGGLNNNIDATNINAVVLGGNTIKLTGSTYIDTAAVSNLAIFNTPTAGGTNDVLTWNPTTKKIGKVTQASLSGGGSTSPAGVNTNIQFNNGGAFGANSGFTYTVGSSLLRSQNIAITTTPSAGLSDDILTWNATSKIITKIPQSNFISGSTGTVDNFLLRSDGTNTRKLQASAVSIDDSGNMSIGVDSGLNRNIYICGTSTNVGLLTYLKGPASIFRINSGDGVSLFDFTPTQLTYQPNNVAGFTFSNGGFNFSKPFSGNDSTINGAFGASYSNNGSNLTVNAGSAYGVSGNGNGGNLVLNVGNGFGSGKDGNMSLLSSTGAGTYGSGERIIYIPNRKVAPSSNPTSGGYLYVEAGALLYRGSSGTVTTIGPA